LSNRPELCAIGFRTACGLSVDFLAARGAQLLELRPHALAVCRNPCISIFHAPIYAPDFCNKKALSTHSSGFRVCYWRSVGTDGDSNYSIVNGMNN